MKSALALLCCGAVAFLLRVLFALLQEYLASPRRTKVFLARFDPLRLRIGKSSGERLITQEIPLTSAGSFELDPAVFRVELSAMNLNLRHGVGRLNLRRL